MEPVANRPENPHVGTCEFITGNDTAPDPEIAGFRGSRLVFTNIQSVFLPGEGHT